MKAEPRPTKDVNRDSGTATANGRWFQRLLGVMVLAWFVSAVGNWTTVCWWHLERMQWGANASKYQQEIQKLKQQVLQLQLLVSSNSVVASHPSESEIVHLLSQSSAPQVFEALLTKPLTLFD